MDDKESSSNGFPQIGEILESIKTELKEELKAGLENIKAELKAEFNGIKTDDSPPRVHRPPQPPPPFGDFPDIEIPEFEIFDGEDSNKTEEFTFSGFTGIEVGGGAFYVEIVCSDSYSVTVSAIDRLFRNLSVSQEGETLMVNQSRHVGWIAQLTRPKVRITLPLLKYLRLSAATRATLSGFSSSENFRLSMSGASGVSGEITAGDVQFELSGASRARLTGTAKDIVIDAAGANHLDLNDFPAQNVAVKLSGAARCSVKVEGRLDARLSGASRLSYIGNPVMGDIRTSGASRLSRG